MPEKYEKRRASDTCECVCICTVTSHSFIIAKGRWGTEITDTAGRMVDTNLFGWIYEWLGSEGHVDGCVHTAQTLPAVTLPLWRHCCPQTERARRRQTEGWWSQMPRGSTITLTVVSWLYDVHSWSRKHIRCRYCLSLYTYIQHWQTSRQQNNARRCGSDQTCHSYLSSHYASCNSCEVKWTKCYMMRGNCTLPCIWLANAVYHWKTQRGTVTSHNFWVVDCPELLW